jgi:para-nitrobenzyl esterase
MSFQTFSLPGREPSLVGDVGLPARANFQTVRTRFTTALGSALILSWIPALAIAAAEPAPSETPKPMGVLKVCSEPIRVETGLVRGLIVGPADDVQLYRGIPYAAPPVGELRWRPPQAAHAWSGVRESYAFGTAAPQKPVALLSMFPGMKLGAKTSEDCLYLNVWTPVRRSERPLPVMLWIHGGGYVFGAASQELYDGANLTRHGVVVVAINYRLGPFGFLAHPQLSAESGRSASGNYGLMDQMEALRWVKRNIASFGGDPERVTIFGESAGGNSVYTLLLSPLAKGLFQRAISQSGASLNFAYLKESHYGYRSAEKMGLEFAKQCGVPEGDSQLAALRDLSADDILKASSAFEAARSLEFRSDRIRFGPIVDGWVIPEDPMTLFEHGRINAVPLIVGANANEGSLFTLQAPPLKGSDEYHSLLEKTFGTEAAGTLGELYPPSNLRRAINDLMGDYLFVAPARYVARAFDHAKIPVYLYHFAHPTPGPMGKMLGAHHGAEIAYVFDNMQLAPHRAAVDDQIRDALVSYWVQFAAAGNPNRPALPDWPVYNSAADRCLLVSDTITIAESLRKTKLDAIDGLMEAWRRETGLTRGPRAAPAPTKPAALSPHKSAQPGSRPAANKTTRLEPGPHSQKLTAANDRRLGVLKASRVGTTGKAKADTRSVRTSEMVKAVRPPDASRTADLETRLRQARFLAKAGLGPLTIDTLREIIKEARGTTIAKDAQRLLDSIPKSNDPSIRRAVTANATP